MKYSQIQRRVLAALANDNSNRSLTINALRDRTQDDLPELREALDALVAADLVVIDQCPAYVGYELHHDVRDLYYSHAAATKLYTVVA